MDHPDYKEHLLSVAQLESYYVFHPMEMVTPGSRSDKVFEETGEGAINHHVFKVVSQGEKIKNLRGRGY